MVFGLEKLQNDVFCLTEERDYFQGKYLEQVSEIVSLKEELRKSKKEVNKLRKELMKKVPAEDESTEPDILSSASPRSRSSFSAAMHSSRSSLKNGISATQNATSLLPEQEVAEDNEEDNEENNVEEEQADDESSLSDDEDDEGGDKEPEDIRQSAEKLLQWASYRTSTRSTTEHSSVASPASSHPSVLGSSIPRTINTESMDSLLEHRNDPKEQEDTASVNSETDSEDGLSDDERPKDRTLVDRFENLVTSL